MVRNAKNLWDLVLHHQHIDPADLAERITEELRSDSLDYRTRLLIRDGLEALEQYWGEDGLANWLSGCPLRERIDAIRSEHFERPGFPSLKGRVMEPTKPEDIERYLREVGVHLHHKERLYVRGSASLILSQYLRRRTEDIDVVDEVPAEIRTQYQLLNELEQRYGLHLAHFASHYLPSGWEQRLHSAGTFGAVEVSLVDVYDVFLSKLFSPRTKDRDDLRALIPQLDKETVIRKLRDTTTALRADPKLLRNAEENWFILFGESLPV